MIDWVNAILRAVMCFAFLMLIVRPMLVALSRKEVNQLEIEDAAQSSVNSAFAAWRNNHGLHYYDNPEYAEMMASNPNLELPDLSQPIAPALPAPEVAPQEETPTAEVAQTKEAEHSDPESLVGEKTEVSNANASADAASTEVASLDDSESLDEDEDESSGMDNIKAQMAAEKKKKKQQSIPPELLNANSYEDKLMLVRMIVQQEQGRVSGVLKKMIQG